MVSPKKGKPVSEETLNTLPKISLNVLVDCQSLMHIFSRKSDEQMNNCQPKVVHPKPERKKRTATSNHVMDILHSSGNIRKITNAKNQSSANFPFKSRVNSVSFSWGSVSNYLMKSRYWYHWISLFHPDVCFLNFRPKNHETWNPFGMSGFAFFPDRVICW